MDALKQNLTAELSPAAAPEKTDAKTPARDVATLPKTSGERFYDIFQFIVGKVFIVAVTAVLAFGANQDHAPDKILGVPNLLKKLQAVFNKTIRDPLANKGDFLRLFGGAAAGTMMLSHGGNFFAPFIKWLENGRENIANFYNKRFGTPEDVEIAHERLKDIPKQNWMDVIKGRIMAWSTVFAAMLTAYTVVGKDTKGRFHKGEYFLDIYEDKFARLLAGWTGVDKAIAATPVRQVLTKAQADSKMYRFGKILALDMYATTAGIIIWNIFSRLSAKKRTRREQIAHDQQIPSEWDTSMEPEPTVELPTTHRDKHPSSLPQGYAEMARQSQAEPAAQLSA